MSSCVTRAFDSPAILSPPKPAFSSLVRNVCMSVLVRLYGCLGECMCLCIGTWVSVCVSLYGYLDECVCECARAHMYICLCMGAWVSVYVSVCVPG